MAGHNVPAIFVFAHFVIPGSLAVLAPRNDRIGFQTAKRHRPYSLRRRVRRLPLPSPLDKRRGDGAPQGASLQLTPCGVRVLGEGRAPRGAPSRLFCPRGR